MLYTGIYSILLLPVMMYLQLSTNFYENDIALLSFNRHYSDRFPHMGLFIAYFKASQVEFSKL